MTTEPKYLTVTEVAKLTKRTLKAAFPTVAFSVKSSKYSGGSSISVTWQDGPTDAMVNKVVGAFHGADFDGMTDCKYYREAATVEGLGLVSFGNDYMFTRRRESDEFRARVAAHVDRKYGIGDGINERENLIYRIARRAFVLNGMLAIEAR